MPPPDAIGVTQERAVVLTPGAPLPRDWQARYLAHVRQHGHYALAARVAGISQRTATRYRATDPDFDEACREAREEAADQTEIDMLDSAKRSDNPAGFIVRLKALRPEQYIEKHAILNLSITGELPAGDVAITLARMLQQACPETSSLLLAPTQETGSRAVVLTPDGPVPATPAEPRP